MNVLRKPTMNGGRGNSASSSPLSPRSSPCNNTQINMMNIKINMTSIKEGSKGNTPKEKTYQKDLVYNNWSLNHGE